MNTLKNFWLVLGSLLIMIFFAQTSVAQNFNLDKSASSVVVEGTSNIHDWEMVAEDFQGNLNVKMEEGQLVKINELNFALVAESLKSGKNGMDKNAYKALNTDDHKRITYRVQNISNIDCTSTTDCKVTTSGQLNIAGTTKTVDVTFDAEVSGNRIILTGSKTLNVTNFNVDPPTAMFGTITTGDEVTINFQSTFSK